MKIINKCLLVGAFSLLSLGTQAELISNGGFETSPLTLQATQYIYPQAEYAGWLFVAGSGVINATGSSAWYGASSPLGYSGNNYAFVQRRGSLQQTFTLNADSWLSLDWLDVGRPSLGSGGLQTYQIKIDGVVHGLFNSQDNNVFSARSISGISLSEGEHSLEFAGTVDVDSTVFIDSINLTSEVISPVPLPASLSLLALSLVGFSLSRKKKVQRKPL